LFSAISFAASAQQNTAASGSNTHKLLERPLLCQKNAAMSEPLTSDAENSDSTSFPFIRATEIYRSYTNWLNKLFNDGYVEKCLDAARLEGFTVMHPRSGKAAQ